MGRIALCLYGKFTGKNDRGEVQSFSETLKYFKDNVITEDVDVFIHGWDDDTSVSKELIESFQPKKHVLEKQINFTHPFKTHNFIPNGPWNTQKGIFNNYSRFYSLKKCFELVDGDYDLVIVSRFDCIFYEKIDYTKFESDKFYISNWHRNKEGWGVNDSWFISDYKLMKEFTLIYDRLEDYLNLSGDFLKFLKHRGLSEKNITSGHAIWRYRMNEMGIDDKIYTIGLEYNTWGLLRRLNQRTNKLWSSNFDIREPKKLI